METSGRVGAVGPGVERLRGGDEVFVYKAGTLRLHVCVSERFVVHKALGQTLAAVQVAQALGAEVFATAGTKEKRAYLRTLGIGHVFDSRTLDFAE